MKPGLPLTLCIAVLTLSGFVSAGESVLMPIDNSQHVILRLSFQTGSVDDPQDTLGLTYLTGKSIEESGTQSMSKEQIDELLYPMAGAVYLQFDKETAIFTTTIHVDHLEKVYPIFRDLLLAPRFDEVDFKRVKENAIKTVTEDMPDNNDERLSKRVFDGLMYEKHPYGHLTEGTESGLSKITLDMVKDHYAKVYTRSRLTIGIAGKFDTAFAKRVEADFDKLPKGTVPQKLKPIAMPEGIVARIISKERAFGTAIYMGFPLAIDRSHDDFAALLVANSYLGEHRSSYGRLYQEMRGKRSLNYGDYSYVEWYPAGHATTLPMSGTPRSLNTFNIWIRPVQIAEQFQGVEGLEQPELGNGVHAVRQAVRELKMLVDEGLSESDFQLSRTYMTGFLRHYVQSPYQRLGYLMDGKRYGRDDYIEEIIANMGKLTREDVNRALKKYLQYDNFYLAVITDDSEAEKLAQALSTNASAPIVYKPEVKAGLDQAILDEDKVIDGFKLNVKHIEVVPKANLFK